jgi:acetolactate synthase-1/3 small subunit
MAMRRGHHTSRVLKALGTSANGNGAGAGKLSAQEIIPNEFLDVHEEED